MAIENLMRDRNAARQFAAAWKRAAKHERAKRRDLLEALADVTNQACTMPSGELDSVALSAYASAMRTLAEHGVIEITSEVGRRVIGKWRKP
jgi:hypothetical protein